MKKRITSNGKRQQITAYHEAGHSVCAWWFGQLKKRDYVTIVADLEVGSLGHLRNPARFIAEWERTAGSSGRAVLQAEKFVVGCLGGQAAEDRFTGLARRYPVSSRRDRQQAIDVLTHLAGSEEEIKAYFRLLQVRAENLVARFWPEVKAVAERLLLKQTLTADEIRATCLSARLPPMMRSGPVTQ